MFESREGKALRSQISEISAALGDLLRDSHALTRNQRREIDRLIGKADRISEPTIRIRRSADYADRLRNFSMLRRSMEVALREFSLTAENRSTSRRAVARTVPVSNAEEQVRIKIKTRPARPIEFERPQNEIVPEEQSFPEANISYLRSGPIPKMLKKLPEGERTLETLDAIIRQRGGSIKRREFIVALQRCNVDAVIDIAGDYKLVNRNNGKAVKMNNDEGASIGVPYMLNIIRELRQAR
jgi:hypothetical protein